MPDLTTQPVSPTPPVQPVTAKTAPEPAAPAPATPAPTGTPAPEAGKPFNWKDQFSEADRNHDGKLVKSELKLGKARATDLNKDGQVDYREFHAAKVQANSFAGLDHDHNGTLDAKELAKLQRFDNRAYGDGQAVTKEQFVQARRAELQANRTAYQLQQFKQGLSKADAEKMKRFEGADGKLSAQEYVAGRHTLWQEWHDKRRDTLFANAGGKNGVLDVSGKDGARYKSYDADGDGKVSKDEFQTGYKADLKKVWDARVGDGKLSDKGVRDRLCYGKDALPDTVAAAKSGGKSMPTDATGKDLFANRNDWFISQYGDKYNTNEDVPGVDNANCGPTSLTMVAKAFGKINPNAAQADAAIEKTRAMMGDGTSQYHGTSAEGVIRGAKGYGLDAKLMQNISLGDIKGELDKGRLPIINGNLIRTDGSIGGGHFYVVTKIDGDKAYLNDPYSKTGPRVVSTNQLMTSVNSHFGHQMVSVGDGH